TRYRENGRAPTKRDPTYRERGRWVVTLGGLGRNGKRLGKKRGGGQWTSSTSAEVFTGPVYTSLPRRDLDLTPVMTRRTRTVCSNASSTEQPQMIRACGLIFCPTISAVRSASETVRSPPH